MLIYAWATSSLFEYYFKNGLINEGVNLIEAESTDYGAEAVHEKWRILYRKSILSRGKKIEMFEWGFLF